MSFNHASKNILEAYNRFVVGIQNKLIDGSFVMTKEVFMEMVKNATGEIKSDD